MSKYGIPRFKLSYTLSDAAPPRRAIYAERAEGAPRVWVCPAEDISYISPETMVELLNAGLAAPDMLEALEVAVDAIGQLSCECVEDSAYHMAIAAIAKAKGETE